MNVVPLVVILTVSLLAAPVVAQAQQAAKVHRIGMLLTTSQQTAWSMWFNEFRATLKEFGYTEGRNLIVEWRSTEGNAEQLPSLAADLVRLKVELIVAQSSDATAAAMKATTTIPIVMMASIDPVGAGFVKSLARPGGNVTGTAYNTPEVAGKILAVLKEAVPKATAVSVLLDRSWPRMDAYEAETKAVASRLGISLDLLDVRVPGDVAGALAKIKRARPSALYVVTTSAVRHMFPDIIQFAARNRLPAIYTGADPVRLGGLMSYSANLPEIRRRTAGYVDKILKGAKPADLPVEQPTKWDLVINLKTAKALGLTIPPALLMRADQVIE